MSPEPTPEDGGIAVEPDSSETSTELSRLSPLRFLLIEDTPTDAELILALLDYEFPNTRVDTASSLGLAMFQLAGAHYDLIIADLTLPDAEGSAVVHAVREACSRTPLVVLTGRIDADLAMWALAQGAQDYVEKALLDGRQLGQTLLHSLQRERTEQRVHDILTASLAKERRAVESLGELNRAKSDFVATVSHELRTPLTSLIGYAELLQAESLTPRQTGFVDAIARNAARLSSLTNDLLLVSALGTRQRETASVAVDLASVLCRVGEVLSILANARDVRLDFIVPEHTVVVTGDGEHLERAVQNLMSNAIKFSDIGATVTCRLSSGPTHALIEVVDTGMGIPLDEQRAVFTPFFRGAETEERAVQGIGLGLHIVESIVKNHGGDISLRSAPTKGSTFTVRLPLAQPAEGSAVGAAATNRPVTSPPSPDARRAAS